MDSLLVLQLDFTRASASGDPYGFQFEPQDYVMRRADGTSESVRFVWDRALLDQLQALHDPSSSPGSVRASGAALRAFVLSAGWDAMERAIVEHVQRGGRVHLTVRSSAAELFALPWELLPIQQIGLSIGEHPAILLRYEWPGTRSRATSTRQRAGARLLLAWSAAGGAVPISEHRAAVEGACGGDPLPLRHEVLANASMRSLADTLRRASDEGEPVAGLHILCHGAQDGETYGLLLDRGDASGEQAFVDPAELTRVLLSYADTLRLVVLSACSSGDPGALGNRLGSVAQMLHRAGIQAVIGSRFPLSVAGATYMAAALYRALLRERSSLEAAVRAVQEALNSDATNLDWTSVQLYARERDGDASDVLALMRSSAADDAIAPATFDAVAIAAPASVEPGPRNILWPMVAAFSVVAVCVTAIVVAGDDEPPAPDAAVLEKPASAVAGGSGGAAPLEPVDDESDADADDSSRTDDASATAAEADTPSAAPAIATPSDSPAGPTKGKRGARQGGRKTSEIPLALTVSGGALVSCDGERDPSAYTTACRSRWSSVGRGMKGYVPALEDCIKPKLHGITVRPRSGDSWGFSGQFEVKADGGLRLLQINSTSSAKPLPEACFKRAFEGRPAQAQADAPTIVFNKGFSNAYLWTTDWGSG